MQLRYARHDGQTKAAPRLAALVETMKALEDRASFFRWNTGAAVAHREAESLPVAGNANRYFAAFRGVAHGVVDQIADQHPQPFGLSGKGGVADRLEIEIDVAGENLGAKVGTDCFSQFGQIDRLRVGQAGFRVEAGEQQHLVDEVGGAGQATLQLLE